MQTMTLPESYFNVVLDLDAMFLGLSFENLIVIQKTVSNKCEFSRLGFFPTYYTSSLDRWCLDFSLHFRDENNF